MTEGCIFIRELGIRGRQTKFDKIANSERWIPSGLYIDTNSFGLMTKWDWINCFASVIIIPAKTVVKKGAKKPEPQQISTPNSNGHSKLLIVSMNEEAIQQIAYKISQEGKTWEECTWLLAENELRYGAAYALPNESVQYGGLSSQLTVDPSRVQNNIKQEDVQKMAYEISQRGPSLQDLHWFIAQRLFVGDFLVKTR